MHNVEFISDVFVCVQRFSILVQTLRFIRWWFRSDLV